MDSEPFSVSLPLANSSVYCSLNEVARHVSTTELSDSEAGMLTSHCRNRPTHSGVSPAITRCQLSLPHHSQFTSRYCEEARDKAATANETLSPRV